MIQYLDISSSWWIDLCFFVGFLASFLLEKLN